MLTGCSPVFLLVILGVGIGSWMFGDHTGARITGLLAIIVFLAYFALLNWTAQNRQKQESDTPRKKDLYQEITGPHDDGARREPFTEDDRAEWRNYLKTEGKILWFGVAGLLLALLYLTLKN